MNGATIISVTSSISEIRHAGILNPVACHAIALCGTHRVELGTEKVQQSSSVGSLGSAKLSSASQDYSRNRLD